MQAVVGAVVASLAGVVTGRWEVFWSALYGAGVVVVPALLMARGMTSRLSVMSPGAGAVSFMFLEFAKILLSVAMLVMAPKVVPDLNWFAVLAGLVAGLKVYWFALLWRGR